MTTALQATANARNATESTGPKTAAGKARSARNALRHGLRSELPVLPGERSEDWQAHHDGILGSLAPSGGLETALAERVALCSWRLRRVAAYETTVTALGIEAVSEAIRRQAEDRDGLGDDGPLPACLASAEEQLRLARDGLAAWDGADRLLQGLPDLPDDAPVSGGDVDNALQHLIETASEHYDGHRLPDPQDGDWLTKLGVPEDEVRDAYEWDGWTAGLVRRAWKQIAAAAKANPETLLARVVKDCRKDAAGTRQDIETLEKKVKELRRQVKVREHRHRQRRMLAGDVTLNKITRYEAHLSRQMLQALHTLERLQAVRAGRDVPPPAALDVTVDSASPFVDGQ